jgi:hypothetical protein
LKDQVTGLVVDFVVSVALVTVGLYLYKKMSDVPSMGSMNNPQGALIAAGCTVYNTDINEKSLDWDYLAGYETVKRQIEDTVLLALSHGDVYN